MRKAHQTHHRFLGRERGLRQRCPRARAARQRSPKHCSERRSIGLPRIFVRKLLDIHGSGCRRSRYERVKSSTRGGAAGRLFLRGRCWNIAVLELVSPPGGRSLELKMPMFHDPLFPPRQPKRFSGGPGRFWLPVLVTGFGLVIIGAALAGVNLRVLGMGSTLLSTFVMLYVIWVARRPRRRR